MAILTTAEYPAIRAAIDVDLDIVSLPDTTIAFNIYQLAADQDVIDRDPLAETRTGIEAARILRAAIFFCAARLTPAVIQTISVSIAARDASYSRPKWDAEKKAAELRQLAESEIAKVLTPGTGSALMPKMFVTAMNPRGF